MMNRKFLLAFGLLALCMKLSHAVEAKDDTATNGKEAAPGFIRPDAPLGWKNRNIGKSIWGKEVNGLQAGISFSDDDKSPHEYRTGDSISFYVVLRNNSKKPISIEYARSDTASDSNVSIKVLDEKEREVYLSVEASNGWFVGARRQTTLAPGDAEMLWMTQLKIGPLGESSGPALYDFLDAAPMGKYKISYSIDFSSRYTKPKKAGAWTGKLETGQLGFEVVEKAKASSSILRPAAKSSLVKSIWGREVNGLQAAISFPDGIATPYQIAANKTAFFYVVVRNNGKTPIFLEFVPGALDDVCNASFSANILDAKKNVISAKDGTNARDDVCIYAAPVPMTLAPGAVKRLWNAKFKVNLLHLQSDLKPRDVDVKGEYRIGYALDLKKSAEKEGAWIGKLETGQLAFEVVPNAR